MRQVLWWVCLLHDNLFEVFQFGDSRRQAVHFSFVSAPMFHVPAEFGSLLRGCQTGLSRQVQAAVFMCKHSLSGEYLVIADASPAPPILNPNALIQPRFAKSPVATPALAIMNLTVWSFPPTLRFISDLLSIA